MVKPRMFRLFEIIYPRNKVSKFQQPGTFLTYFAHSQKTILILF